ncbi:MAG: ribokinase [Caldilineae bacterium]|nr:MAG: ribokinase [Caldilineae bacterium]
MAILNFGSLNIDHVYQVDHFVRPGETLPSRSYQRFPGGKGFNQSIALARAGVPVHHAGKVGEDGVWLRDMLNAEGAEASRVEVIDEPTGHAIIQVTPSGENAIVIHGGANRAITQTDAQRVLAGFGAGDWLLLQNEISAMPEIMALARAQGMEIAFNPAPMQSQVLEYPLQHVSIFFVNETEGADLTGETSPSRILAGMRNMFPRAATVLTLGEDGAIYVDGEREVHAPARQVTPVDTTAAGDTFIGYFLAAWTTGASPEAALDLATRAAAICVTRPGAAPSIPRRGEVMG